MILFRNIKKVKWAFLGLYCFLAIAISFPINSGFLNNYWQQNIPINWLKQLTFLLACLGPLIAAIIIVKINPTHKQIISFKGNHFFINAIIALAPLISFSVTGINNAYGIQENLLAFLFCSINLLYAFGEEYGWRKYMQDELRSVNYVIKYITIGFVWYIWHWRFNSRFELFIFPLIVIGSSFLIGKLTEDTKSYFVAAGLHSLIIILSNTQTFDLRVIVGIIVTVVIWILTSAISNKTYKLRK